ncbi:hypothetical protein KJ781_01815 [Patescibacteria group bacterium]|nr:hypothetical protein [Patescibacteria group bacterium]MBU1448279.1 hypothetical protein [Patescibacteria group bacterium]MBU2613162.1 hypothetical protein [Patescibacteria group bacterium]
MAKKRIRRPDPLYTYDPWHELAPIAVGLAAAVVLTTFCVATGRDIRSTLFDVSVFHGVAFVAAIAFAHLIATRAPLWFLRRRLSYLRGLRARLEAALTRRRLARASSPLSASAKRTLPPSYLRRVRRLVRITRRIDALEAHERTLTRPSS